VKEDVSKGCYKNLRLIVALQHFIAMLSF